LPLLVEAKKAGKIHYTGFTGHKDAYVHLRMLEVAAQHNFNFETCQMPLNVMDAHFRSFGHDVLPKLVEQASRCSDGNVLKSGRVRRWRIRRVKRLERSSQ
jgi:predicted aldo/keto reductase-like oxidoreductase